MLKLVESLDRARYMPRVYVVADSDTLSGRKAVELERRLAAEQVSPCMPICCHARACMAHTPGGPLHCLSKQADG